MVSLNCVKLSGSGSYFVVSSESIFQLYLEFRAAWKHFYLPEIRQVRSNTVHISELYRGIAGRSLICKANL